ncbi:secreted protein [Melampsora americana]|nr:secreted protein [Melampsora americana]
MLHIFIKISLLLFTLWVHDSKVLAAGNGGVPFGCNRKFTTLSRDTALCKGESPDEKGHKCALKSCWYAGHQWIPMTSCTLNGSKDKGTSSQHCTSYEFISWKDGFTCINSGNVPYTCNYAANAGQIMRQSDFSYISL